MKIVIHEGKEFTAVPYGKGYYFINRDTTELLSLMRPNSPLIMKPSINSAGYYMSGFFTKKDRINVNIHRAMMDTFVENPENKAHVNHIDGNKLNNDLSNLEWTTPKENATHAHATGLSDNSWCHVAISRYSLSGTYIDTFDSVFEAAKASDIDSANIVVCAQGKVRQSGYYLWSYDQKDSIPPYDGPELFRSITVIDLDTGVETLVKSISKLSDFTGVHRASIQRRFKKYGNSFTENNYLITKNLVI